MAIKGVLLIGKPTGSFRSATSRASIAQGRDAAITARYWPSVIRGVGGSNASAALSDLPTSRVSYPSENVRRTGLTGWPTAAMPPTCGVPSSAVSYTHLRAHETDSYLV